MDKKEYTKLADKIIELGSIKSASEHLNIPESTIRGRIKTAKQNGLLNKETIEKLNNLKDKTDVNLINKALKLYEQVESKSELASILKISTDSVYKLFEKARRLGLYDPNLEQIKKLKSKIDELNKSNNQLNKELELISKNPNYLLNKDRDLSKTKEELKIIESKLSESEKEVQRLRLHNEVLTKLNNRKRVISKISPKSNSNKAQAVACMIASDWHIEEPVDPDSLNGYNEYNLDIARKRAENFFKNGLYLVKKEMMNANINTVMLGLLGDFISNYIHEELEEEAQLSPPMAIEMAEDLICNGIDFLLEDGCFEKLIIPCAIGNHGRTTKKTRFSTGWQNSYEMLMYRHLQKLYSNNSRVEIKTTKGYHNIIKIFDHTIRIHHGDAINYSQGIGGITIPVNRAISRWNDKEHATLDIFGHFHQLHFQSKFVSNGSLIGYNSYAERFGCAPESPRQAFFLLDKEHGRTVCAPIFVE